MKPSLASVLTSVLAILSASPATGDSAGPAAAVSSTGRPYNAGQAQSTNPTLAGTSVSPIEEPKSTITMDASPMSTLSGTCSQMSLGDNANLNGFVPFPSTYAWNTNISSAPLDPNNAAITSAAGFAGLHLHHDFSSVAGGNYGIPYVVVDSSSTPLVPINVIDYADESDVALAPFPLTAPIEGSPADCDGWPDTYVGDSHVLVLDRNACMLYETFNTHRCNGAWNSSSETIWDLQSSEQRPWGWTSADAAGLAIFPGLVRYDEVAAGAINHAIRFTMQQTKNDANDGYFVEPASHAAGTVWGVSNVMGMRIRLKASFDISGYSAANQVILTAMKKYGMILADNGGYFYFQGVPDPRWDDDDLLNLDSIQSSNFEVVQMTPAFPGYDAGTAPTGQPPTINSFTASAPTVVTGTPVTLTWNSSNDSYDFIDVLGGVHGGSVTTTPTTTTTYTLNATNQYGRSTMQVTVNVSQTILSQTINFAALSNQPFGAAPSTVTATASSGLSVSFNSQTLSICTVSGSQVTLVAVGTCTIQATQAGNTNYAAATPVNESFQVTPGSPVTLTITIVGSGTVTANPPSANGAWANGTQVCLTDTPAPDWQFNSWSGATLDSSNCLTMNGNAAVTASFTCSICFEGNGQPDLVFQNDTTGQVTVWYMGGAQGATFQGWNYLNSSSLAGWKVVGAADFNGDGHPDLVWQNDTTRQVTVWYMGGAQGNTFLGWNYLSSVGVAGWKVVGAADFNGDGTPDLIWQNDTTRQVTVWYMGGALGNTFLGWNYLSSTGVAGWTVVGSADFNGDGHPDLVWQNDTTGQVTVWYMGGAQGATFLGWNYLSSAGVAGWTVVGAADFNGDGTPDLIWQNDTTRQVTVWYMGGSQGNAFLGWNYLSGTVAGWTLVAP
jgi:hypothetical protein